VRRMRRIAALLLPALALLGGGIAVLLPGCGDDEPPPAPPPVAPKAGLGFAFVDVAPEMGYTMRNRSGRDYAKEFIVEAMPPGIAVADFDADGRMDLYCPNGNDVRKYDPKKRVVTLLGPDEAPRNELYLNRGDRFERAGARAGVDDPSWAFGAVAGDVDNDGDPDLFVCNWGSNLLYRNRGDGTFEEIAGAAGAAGDPRAWSTGACLFDYDRDGDLDLYVCQYADMYDFFDDQKAVTIHPDGRIEGRSCDWKGLAVYCGPLGLKPQNDVLLENLLVETGELKFRDVTRERGLWFEFEEPLSRERNSGGPFYGFQPVAFDIDGDGWMDVFVANDSQSNLCWMNKAGKKFVDEAPQMSLARSASDYNAQASMGVAVGDLNNDLVFDVVVTEFSHEEFNVLIGERLPNGLTVFNEKAPNIGVRDMTFFKLGWGANFLDPDLDGDQDFFFACGHVFPEVDDPRFDQQQTRYRQGNLLILNERPEELKVRNVSRDAGPGIADVYKCSRASALIDFDDDGDMDLATTELNDAPCLLRCDVAPSLGRHWLMVRLRGDPGARVPLDPAGAVVTVTAGGARQARLLLFGSSFQCSEDPRRHFGLGDSATADVEVLWPNQTKTVRRGVKADQVITIDLKKG